MNASFSCFAFLAIGLLAPFSSEEEEEDERLDVIDVVALGVVLDDVLVEDSDIFEKTIK